MYTLLLLLTVVGPYVYTHLAADRMTSIISRSTPQFSQHESGRQSTPARRRSNSRRQLDAAQQLADLAHSLAGSCLHRRPPPARATPHPPVNNQSPSPLRRRPPPASATTSRCAAPQTADPVDAWALPLRLLRRLRSARKTTFTAAKCQDETRGAGRLKIGDMTLPLARQVAEWRAISAS